MNCPVKCVMCFCVQTNISLNPVYLKYPLFMCVHTFVVILTSYKCWLFTGLQHLLAASCTNYPDCVPIAVYDLIYFG